MKKLSKRDLWWITREIKRGNSVYQTAKKRGVSTRWVRSLWKHYQATGEIFTQKSCGRKRKDATQEQVKLILETWKKYGIGAVSMEHLIKQKEGISMPHNRIHKVLKAHGKAIDQKSKQKKRKWVRYERKKSNSLWHVDWSKLDDGTNLIVYEDDASRFITGYGIYKEATINHSLLVFRRAARRHGAPKQLLSDNGTQFRFSEMFDKDIDIKNRFQKAMEHHGVKQIFTRVHRPQANGKVERLFNTIKRYIKHFGTVKKAIDFYNFTRPHMSLDWGALETPHQAFLRKRRK